jgi:hypothetical protein
LIKNQLKFNSKIPIMAIYIRVCLTIQAIGIDR